MLFDDIERDRKGPMKEGESIYEYYNSSARAEIEEKRNNLEEWVSRFSDDEQKEYRSRMRGSSQDFIASELEIMIHEVMISNGHDVKIHPPIDNENRVDFFASKGEQSFYLEATTVQDDPAEIASANRRAQLIDRVNLIKMPPGHVLGFDVISEDISSPKLNAFVRDIEKLIRDLGPIEPGSHITKQIEHSGWMIEIDVFNSGSNVQHERAIGILQGKVGFIDPSGDLRKRLDKKSRRYGKPNAPFVLAISDLKNSVFGNDDYLETTFGDRSIRFNIETKEAHSFSRFNGFFGYSESPQNEHISAIAFFPSSPYWAAIAGEKEPILIHNPFATYPLQINTLGLTSLYFDAERVLQTSVGNSIRDMILSGKD